MNKICFTLAIPAILLFSSCSAPEIKNTGDDPPQTTVAESSKAPVAASTQPDDGIYTGIGKITKINMDLGSVELDHQEIVGMMPAMQMEFYVKDKSVLDGFKVGDDVDFTLEYKHPSETILSLKKIK